MGGENMRKGGEGKNRWEGKRGGWEERQRGD